MTTEDWLKHGIDAAWWVLLVFWVWSAWGNKAAARERRAKALLPGIL
jgi:hypothetical protein